MLNLQPLADARQSTPHHWKTLREITWKARQLEVRIRGPRDAVVHLSELLFPLGLTSTHLAPEIENDSIFRSYLVAPADRIDWVKLDQRRTK
jgi:hypothetical protein